MIDGVVIFQAISQASNFPSELSLIRSIESNVSNHLFIEGRCVSVNFIPDSTNH